MSLKVLVGLSQKSTIDFQSEGRSISIDTEMDPSLLSKPDEFQAAIASLYEQAQDALDRKAAQLAAAVEPSATRGTAARPAGTPAPHTSRSTASRQTTTAGRVDSSTPLPATDSQLHAIRAICQSMGLDPIREAMALGLKLKTLDRAGASRMINELKEIQQFPSSAAA